MLDALRRFVRPNVTQHAPAVKMPIMNIDRSHSCDVEYRQITLWRQSIERAVPHKIARLMERRMCDHTHVNLVERQKTQHFSFVGMVWNAAYFVLAGKRCPGNGYSASGVCLSERQQAPHWGVPQPLITTAKGLGGDTRIPAVLQI